LYSTFSSKLTFEYHHQLMLQRLATTRAKARAGRRRGIHLLQCTQCCSVWAGRRRGIHVHLHSLSHPHSHFSILFRSRKMAATRSIDASHTLYTLYTHTLYIPKNQSPPNVETSNRKCHDLVLCWIFSVVTVLKIQQTRLCLDFC